MFSRLLRKCFLAISIVFCSTAAFAGKAELTTYYPSQYGEYTNLKSTADSYFATTSGSVGVGTTSAISKLDVLGTLSVGNAVTAGAIGKVQITTDGASPINNRLTFGTDGTGWKFAIGKNQAGTVTDYMTFQDNGNLGIGTTSPTVKLEVAGTIRSSQPFWRGTLAANTGANFVQGLVAAGSAGVTLAGNTLTLPTTGLYEIHVRQMIQSNGSGLYLYIRKNGAGVSCAYTATSAVLIDMQTSVLMTCNAGDTIDFYYVNTVSAAWAGAHSEAFVRMII